MIYIPTYKNNPVDLTIYGYTFKYQNFDGASKIKSLKEFEEHGITPYHFLVHKDYNYNIYTIEQEECYPFEKYLHKNIFIELFEYFKSIIPKKRLLLWLFYLNGKKNNFPLFDPDLINIQNIFNINLQIIKKYKKFDKDEISFILHSIHCNKEICEYLENTFQITNIPTKKNEANNFIECFIKNRFIPGIQTLSAKFKIDTNNIISKSITKKAFDTLIVLFTTISKVQREKFYEQLIKLMPKLIGHSCLTVNFIKLIEDLNPIAWNQYTTRPDEGYSNYVISNKSILGYVTNNTSIEIIDYIADKLNPKIITDIHTSHSRFYTIYSLYQHLWDKKDKKSVRILKKLVDIYYNALEAIEKQPDNSLEESNNSSEESDNSSEESDNSSEESNNSSEESDN
jgi:hypothetical protein